jgi:hypothetical protein
MVNNLIPNILNNDSYKTNNFIMKKFAQLFFENNAFIMNLMDFWNQIYGLINWLDCLKIKEFILNFIPNSLWWLNMGWRMKS